MSSINIKTPVMELEKKLLHCKDLYGYHRRKTRVVMVGNVAVGGKNPIRIQSMTTTLTQDTDATVAQAIRLAKAGCEIIRITAPTVEDAKNLGNIKKALLAKGIENPLVADIHFLPAASMEAAEHVEKVRINPGNYVDSKVFKTMEYTDEAYQKELDRMEERFTPLVLKMKKLGRSIRIGTNHGSLSDRIMNRYGDSPEGMVESALEFVRICEKNSYYEIILSMKSSNPKVMIAAYRLLAARMDALGMDYPFHLGVTEAGDGEDGRIKSAIGIGSLLEDGIGDTIRVSLTEEPEEEVPVCRQIAKPFNGREPAPLSPISKKDLDVVFTDNLYHYSRRSSREIKVGPFKLGAGNPVRIISNFSLSHPNAKSMLTLLEAQLANPKSIAPEIIEWPVKNAGDIKELEEAKRILSKETSRLAFLGRFENCPELLEKGLDLVDCALFKSGPEDTNESRKKKFVEFVKLSKEKDLPIIMESVKCLDPEKLARTGWLTPAHNLIKGIEWCESLGMKKMILSFNLPERSHLIHNLRYFAASAKGKDYPIHIRIPPEDNYEEHRISASVAIGSLLCDGIGDIVQAGTGKDPKQDLELIYNILQAAGVRITKTEYVSCPSCGRTLFDLQSTTDRIRSKTNHLKGVKIAIMGCIVNGPGEMADADFGYVGGAPGKINLYVGKECVQKSIPTENADEKLIDLIKQHGKWQEPV